MPLKIFDQRNSDKKTNAERRDQTSPTPTQPDPKLLEKLAKLKELETTGIDEARNRLSEAYQTFLGQLNNAYRSAAAAQVAQAEGNYEAWAAYFQLLKKNFRDAWDFFGVIQSDVSGWFRVAPAGKDIGFLSVNKEGYSFAAGVEQNTSRGAPYPKKWMTVSIAFHSSHAVGIGDERLIGRLNEPDDELIGYAKCTGKFGEAKEQGARELYRKIGQHSLIFTLYTEKHGQHMSEVSVTALEKYTLSELCQPLMVALTNDDIRTTQTLLPKHDKLLLLDRK